MKRVNVGETVSVTLPWSEVCTHLGVAGKVADVAILARGAQILKEDGSKFSFPIGHGEAGIYQDSEGFYIQES